MSDNFLDGLDRTITDFADDYISDEYADTTFLGSRPGLCWTDTHGHFIWHTPDCTGH